MEITPKSQYEDLRNHELKGKGTFKDKQGKRFVLEWVARYRIVNKEKAYERHVLDRPSDLVKIINENMRKIFSKYSLKLLNTETVDDLNDFVPLHKILDPEIQEGLLNPNLLPLEGIKIDALVQEKFDLIAEKGGISVIGKGILPLFRKRFRTLKEETVIPEKEEREYELLYSGKKRKFISSERAEEIRKRKGQRTRNEIFIDDERKEVFFNKTLINEFQGQMYSMLRHFVENEGIGGGKTKIYEYVWKDFTGAANDEKVSGAVDVAKKRFEDILRKHKIGKIEIRAEGIYSSTKVYILKPKRTYCILKKIEDEKI